MRAWQTTRFGRPAEVLRLETDAEPPMPTPGTLQLEVLAAGKTALEITCHRKAETGNDVVHGCGYLLQVYHITLRKYTAPACNAGRLL
ncbi:MAG: hypothetical protein JRF61_08455, partial [Deltaproteobacteria bacterium]|nr:hypothetical protein [Deltaproteobacteria bacterium]